MFLIQLYVRVDHFTNMRMTRALPHHYALREEVWSHKSSPSTPFFIDMPILVELELLTLPEYLSSPQILACCLICSFLCSVL